MQTIYGYASKLLRHLLSSNKDSSKGQEAVQKVCDLHLLVFIRQYLSTTAFRHLCAFLSTTYLHCDNDNGGDAISLLPGTVRAELAMALQSFQDLLATDDDDDDDDSE